MKIPEFLKSKIGRRFAFYTILIGTIMALVLSFFISYQQYKERISFLKKELDTIVIANKPFIEQSLWIMDTHALKLIMKGFLLNNDIVFFQITDENGKIVVSNGIPDNKNNLKKTVPLYHFDKGKKIFIGKLTVEVSKLSAFREAKSLVFITLCQSIILMLILSIIIIILFHHLVSKHLITIQNYTRGITLGQQQKPLKLARPINKHTENDELASMVDTINLMCHKIHEAYQNLKKQANEQIKLERQLQQAQKMESIGRLAGGIAHDFNNVLSIILGYSELLLAQISPNDPIYEKIKAIHDSGNKAASLTRQLLAFSRKQVLEKKVISINKIIRNFLKILSKMVGEDIVIKTYLSKETCTIEADPGQIEQIIMNLIINAKDAMPNGGEIIIETDVIQLDEFYTNKNVEVKPGKYVLLTISDSGEGMDEEVTEKIFEPFFTTKELGRGTGLGLSIVYGIVKQHNGYIFVYSEKNKGTTFKIYFPASDKIPENEESKTGNGEILQGNETILIVDDDHSICQFILDILKPLGYNCLIANSGREAIDIIRKYKGDIHLLLTDIVMPYINGRQLAEIIKKERPDIKIIFMSGYTENVITQNGEFEKGVHYISKPITPITLIQKIRSVLQSN